jgi:hypothetical protein
MIADDFLLSGSVGAPESDRSMVLADRFNILDGAISAAIVTNANATDEVVPIRVLESKAHNPFTATLLLAPTNLVCRIADHLGALDGEAKVHRLVDLLFVGWLASDAAKSAAAVALGHPRDGLIQHANQRRRTRVPLGLTATAAGDAEQRFKRAGVVEYGLVQRFLEESSAPLSYIGAVGNHDDLCPLEAVAAIELATRKSELILAFVEEEVIPRGQATFHHRRLYANREPVAWCEGMGRTGLGVSCVGHLREAPVTRRRRKRPTTPKADASAEGVNRKKEKREEKTRKRQAWASRGALRADAFESERVAKAWRAEKEEATRAADSERDAKAKATCIAARKAKADRADAANAPFDAAFVATRANASVGPRSEACAKTAGGAKTFAKTAAKASITSNAKTVVKATTNTGVTSLMWLVRRLVVAVVVLGAVHLGWRCCSQTVSS